MVGRGRIIISSRRQQRDCGASAIGGARLVVCRAASSVRLTELQGRAVKDRGAGGGRLARTIGIGGSAATLHARSALRAMRAALMSLAATAVRDDQRSRAHIGRSSASPERVSRVGRRRRRQSLPVHEMSRAAICAGGRRGSGSSGGSATGWSSSRRGRSRCRGRRCPRCLLVALRKRCCESRGRRMHHRRQGQPSPRARRDGLLD